MPTQTAPTSAPRGGSVRSRASVLTKHPLLAFFLLAYALTWIGWMPLVAAEQGWIEQPVSPYLHLIGSLGPMLAALLVTAAAGGRAALQKLFGRMVRWRVGARWLLVAALAPALLYLVAAVAVRLFDGSWPDIGQFGRSEEYPGLSLLGYWLANVLFYGYGEEVGWRGFALPHLQRHWSAWSATVLFSVFWALWHLPLFVFSPGLQSLGLIGIPGWYVSLITGAVLLTWLYNSTGGSLLVVALFHGTVDIAINSPDDGVILVNAMGALLTLWGIAVYQRAGRENLSHTPRQTAAAG